MRSELWVIRTATTEWSHRDRDHDVYNYAEIVVRYQYTKVYNAGTRFRSSRTRTNEEMNWLLHTRTHRNWSRTSGPRLSGVQNAPRSKSPLSDALSSLLLSGIKVTATIRERRICAATIPRDRDVRSTLAPLFRTRNVSWPPRDLLWGLLYVTTSRIRNKIKILYYDISMYSMCWN